MASVAIEALDTLKDRTAHKAFHFSLILHCAFIVVFLATSLIGPSSQPIPKRLVVHTVSLNTPPRMKTTVAPKVSAPPQKPEVQSPPIAQEGPEPARSPANPEQPVEQAVEQPSPGPQVAPEAKKSSNTKPAPQGRASAKKTTLTKQTPPPKAAKNSKGAPRTSQNKPSTQQYDQKLLNEALQRLDKTKTATKGGASSGTTSGGTTARVGTVGALHIESSALVAGEITSDDGSEGYEKASPEACYIGDLIRRLQLNVRLPEPGEVRVKLAIKKSGSVVSIQIISKNKASIRQAVEAKLKTIHFSPFGTSFKGEDEHTFSLRLSNDLRWSCN